MRCRCVCKSWYALIANPTFISAHLRQTLAPKNTQHFLYNESNKYASKTGLLKFDSQDQFQAVFRRHYSPGVRVAGSCNGLVCLVDFNDAHKCRFILYNPSISRYLSIPPPPFMPFSRACWLEGLAFDDRDQDYKIVVLHHIETHRAEIYSLNSNLWRSISAPIPEIGSYVDRPATFVNGRLHWAVQAANENVIMVFDVRDETFGRISLPQCLVRSFPWLNVCEFGESSIAIIDLTCGKDGEPDVWVMKEYGAVESWTSLITAGDRLTGYSEVLGFRNSNQVFIRFSSGHLALQTLDNNLVKYLIDVTPGRSISFSLSGSLAYSMHKYVPSLLLPHRDNNVDAGALAE